VVAVGLAGQQQLAGLGLYNYKARFYDPALGRFISADTITPGGPEGLNRYSYVNNSPINFNDPTGHCGSEFTNGFWKGVYFCLSDLYRTYQEYQGGERNLFKLASHASGVTRKLLDIGEEVGSINSDMSIVFSNKPLSERILPAERIGIKSTLAAATIVGGIQAAKALVGAPMSEGFGGKFLNSSGEIAIFESKPGSGTIKTYDPLGNSAQSLSVAGSPQDAFEAAFGRTPNSGEPYWTTTAGKIGETGRFPYLDGSGSPGHVSIYGGRFNGGEFLKIFTKFLFP
jgi:RHS repeat-associated protein